MNLSNYLEFGSRLINDHLHIHRTDESEQFLTIAGCLSSSEHKQETKTTLIYIQCALGDVSKFCDRVQWTNRQLNGDDDVYASR